MHLAFQSLVDAISLRSCLVLATKRVRVLEVLMEGGDDARLVLEQARKPLSG